MVLYTVVLALPLMLLAVVVMALIPGLPWWLGIVIGLAGATFLAVRRIQHAHEVVVDAVVGDRSLVDSDRFDNQVDGLTLSAGIRRPEVYVLNTADLDAFAVSHNFHHSVIVTRGMVDSLSVVQLEGLVGALMVRLRDGDAEVATVHTALFEVPVIGGWYRPVLGLVAPFVTGPMLSDTRDLLADQRAVSLTRYPPGLRGALEVVQHARTSGDETLPVDELEVLRLIPRRSDGSSGTGSNRGEQNSLPTRSPLELRIAILSEL